ncbi:MAG TPA: hypothetical protein VKI17_08285, partial [Gemmataceae bacterium]|nr:hypothetical protein [Gemmataceae bacterium]
MARKQKIADCRFAIANLQRADDGVTPWNLGSVFNLQSAICNLQFVTAFILLVALPGTCLAADETAFPRGEGFYFNIVKLVTLVAVYLAWVATCRWVDRDATDLDLPTETWSTLLFLAGAVGLVIVWLLPWYWISLLLLIVVFGTAALAYVNLRNQRVPDEERLLTSRHLRELAARYLKLRFGSGDDDD